MKSLILKRGEKHTLVVGHVVIRTDTIMEIVFFYYYLFFFMITIFSLGFVQSLACRLRL